jgi:hypothetical protein
MLITPEVQIFRESFQLKVYWTVRIREVLQVAAQMLQPMGDLNGKVQGGYHESGCASRALGPDDAWLTLKHGEIGGIRPHTR